MLSAACDPTSDADGGNRALARRMPRHARDASVNTALAPVAAPRRAASHAVILALAGLLTLALGLLLYWVERDVSRTLLIPRFDALQAHGMLGAAAGWLPSLLHPLAFGLMTAAVLPPRRAAQFVAVAAWMLVNIAFEIGQHPTVAPLLADALLDQADPGPVARALAAYFRQGRFDPLDIAAAVGGAALAAVWLGWLDRRRRDDDAH